MAPSNPMENKSAPVATPTATATASSGSMLGRFSRRMSRKSVAPKQSGTSATGKSSGNPMFDTNRKAKAMVKREESGEFQLMQIKLKPIGAHGVTIAPEFTGLCERDLNASSEQVDTPTWPFVGGHEVIGTVTEIGPLVTSLKIGDSVGLGWLSGSCGQCAACSSGKQNLCDKVEKTIVDRAGGFSGLVQAQDSFVYKLPENMDKRTAGPLLCAGISIFAPLFDNKIIPTSNIGIIGVGGVGNLALSMANKWGAHVTALSDEEGAEELATSLGAHATMSPSSEEALAEKVGFFDIILVTDSLDLNWDAIASLLATGGILHFVGKSPVSDMQLDAIALTAGEKKVTSSPASGPPMVMAKMFEFCARHGIAPEVEEFNMTDLNNAVEHGIAQLASGSPRSRIVLKNDLPPVTK